MAEEAGKMTFTFLDDDGNPMKNSAQEEETQEEETQDEEQEEQEGDQDTGDSDDDSGDSDDSDSEDSDTDDSEEDSSDDSVDEEDTEDEEEETEEEDVDEEEYDYEDEEDESEEEETDEDDVVDYEELPEAVQKYLDFFNDTGGSMEQFMAINQDFSKLPQDEVIRRHLKQLYPELDAQDIQEEMEELFGFDAEVDSDRAVRRKKIEKKKFYGKALKALQEQSKKYSADLGSSAALPAEAQEAIEFKRAYDAQSKETSKKNTQSRSSFVKQTNKLLGKSFKGFEVQLGDEKVLYKPENVTKTKEQNLNVNNLLNRFLDKDGNVSDVEGYHRALSVASDPEGFAQHFFELGKAAMAEEDAADSKNITTGKKGKARQQMPKRKDLNAPKFKFLDDESSKFKKGKITLRNY